MNFPLRANVRTRLVDGEILLLDDETVYVHELNETGGFVWNLCDGKLSTNEIAQRFSDEFEVDVVLATNDVIHVVEQLRQLQLITN
ncbi:MAG: PqqD family protein [Planctomycetales bacterium]|nr:PqqD family protein [Planctomycetales bacterium]